MSRHALRSLRPGHPFRRTATAPTAATAARSDEDLKLFAVSFTAFFVCFYTFLI